jgi:hypothetical protein
MADVARLKRARLGTPPPPDEASPNLAAPELAPAFPGGRRAAAPTSPAQLAEHMATRLDGRALRRTNRVVPLALRVTPEFDARLRATALREHLLLAEVLERALEAYEQQARS